MKLKNKFNSQISVFSNKAKFAHGEKEISCGMKADSFPYTVCVQMLFRPLRRTEI